MEEIVTNKPWYYTVKNNKFLGKKLKKKNIIQFKKMVFF
jgi:hypothetical protein